MRAKIKDFDEIISKLKEIGCTLSEPMIQDDHIFNQKGIDLKDHNHNTPVLRIREQNNKIIFTLKKNRSGELDCIEKEIEVSNRSILKDIIELLGFELTVEVHKKRREGNYQDYEICLDEVQDELFEFLKKLGVDKEDRVLIGYDSQIWLKHNGR